MPDLTLIQDVTKILDEVEIICNNYTISMEKRGEIVKLKKQILKFKILLPLVGSFNAGKSSILNSFLKSSSLPTDIRPETAIATEIHYGEKDTIKAIKEDGTYDNYEINEIKEIDSNKYTHLEFYTDNEFLSKNKDTILVDMPGLDSGLEIHNKAILQYIKNGVSYIVIIDAEDGSIKKSTINFLKEIGKYDLDAFVLVNKIDKKPEDDILKIKKTIGSQIYQYFGEKFVGAVSTNDNNIEDFYKIINDIDKKECFVKEFNGTIDEKLNSVEQELNIRLNSLDIDNSSIEKTIKKLNQTKKRIKETLTDEEDIIENKFSNEAVNNILQDVKQTLKTHSSSLAQALLSSEEYFKNEINELLRPALIEATDRNLKIVFDSTQSSIDDVFSGDLALISNSITEESNSPDFSAISNGVSKVSNFADSLSSMGDKLTGSSSKGISKIGGAYKSVAVFAGLTTTVIAPWLEVIIVFLPEILSFLNSIFGDKDSQIKMVTKKVEFEIIPQIVSKLRSQVSAGLSDAKDKFLIELHQDMETKQNDIISALEHAQKEKSDSDDEIQEKRDFLNNGLNQLNEIRNKLITILGV